MVKPSNSSKKNMFVKRASLSKRERRYCSCLLDVRDKSKTNPYAICTSSVYNLQGKKRNKAINCDINYNYEKIPIEKIRSLAKEKHVSLYNKNKKLSSKKTLINRLTKEIISKKNKRYNKFKSAYLEQKANKNKKSKTE